MEERVTLAAQVEAKQSSREIAAALARPLATVRKWRQRYLREGQAGLHTRPVGRPAGGALASAAPALKAALLKLRTKHPGWGAQTLRLELAKDRHFTGIVLPSRARIAAYLKEQQLVRPYTQPQALPTPKASGRERPHQEWEMDAQGVTTVAGLGKVSVINILDVHSHFSIDSHACLRVSHPKAETYQQLLRRAFVHYGLPEQISVDHDSAFYDNQSTSPFPSVLHLWLLALGVQMRFIHKQPPLEHAHIERHHQTIEAQALQGQTFADLAELQRHLQARLLFLNQEYPTRALQGQPPCQAFPQARHSGRVYSPEQEAQTLDLQRVYAYLQTGRWFRQTSAVGLFSLGSYRYNATTRFRSQTLELTFEAATHQWQCLPEKSRTPFYLPTQGLTPTALMGSGAPLPAYATYQLALPVTAPATTF